MKNNNRVIAFTDGSANVRNGLGGCGSYILMEDKGYFISNGYRNTKTGRQELRAVIQTLQFIEDKSSNVLIYSDSMYVINTVMEGWLDKWERECWQFNKNTDLCKILKHELSLFTGRVVLKHIKGHQENLGDFYVNGNSIADLLANYRNFKEYKQDAEVCLNCNGVGKVKYKRKVKFPDIVKLPVVAKCGWCNI